MTLGPESNCELLKLLDEGITTEPSLIAMGCIQSDLYKLNTRLSEYL